MPPGPSPKDRSVVARRNKTTTRAKLKAQAKPVIPPLPDNIEWHELARAWWVEAWSSPMRSEWADVDVFALYRGALLNHRIWSVDADGCMLGPKDLKSLSAELRLIEAQFGLSAMSRRSLQWELPGDDDGETGTAKKRAPAKRAAKKATDPRAGFRVVRGGGAAAS
jgi:hypothetical protein